MTHYDQMRQHFMRLLNMHPESAPLSVTECFTLATQQGRNVRCQTIAIMGSHMAEFIERNHAAPSRSTEEKK